MREAVPSAEAEHIMHSAARKVFLSAENKCKKNPVEKMEMYDVFWNCQRKKKGCFLKELMKYHLYLPQHYYLKTKAECTSILEKCNLA